MKKLFAVILLAVLVSGITCSQAATLKEMRFGDEYRVSLKDGGKSTLNVRKEPSMNGRIIERLTYADHVYVWKWTEDGWAYVGWTSCECAWQKSSDGWNHNLFHPIGWVNIKYLQRTGNHKELEWGGD